MFSILKHFKSFLRKKTGQNRLVEAVELALMNERRDFEIDTGEIIKRF